jgi:hypothetical protein
MMKFSAMKEAMPQEDIFFFKALGGILIGFVIWKLGGLLSNDFGAFSAIIFAGFFGKYCLKTWSPSPEFTHPLLRSKSATKVGFSF